MKPNKTPHISFMQKLTVPLFSMILLTQLSFAQTTTPVATVEAENGVLTGGVIIANSTPGYSGTGYVTNFTNTTDKVTVTVSIPSKGFYSIVIRYNSTSGNKTQNLSVNNGASSPVVFPQTSTYSDLNSGKYLFNAGDNTITIQSNWGWMDIDKFTIYVAVPNVYNFTTSLVDTNATTATKSLYNFLLSQFGKKIISGQTDGAYYDTIKKVTGKSPLVRTWDFMHYTAGYPYLWDNATGKHIFGIDPNDKSTENAIAWYNSNSKKGIVGFHWHWCSPGGGAAGTNTFYTQYTTFDITKAVTQGTPEYTLIIRDIDAIAAQLKKLQTAGVPILWRPLHEAGGGWFWWGAKGSAPCKKLYAILYDRLTNYHHLHNLIWEWSTPETDWYPGNNTVDIVGFDSYPGNYNYGTQKNSLDNFNILTGGKKIIAMSENGPIPNPDDCLTYDAPWSYFMSWNDLVMSENERSHVIDVFNNPNVLTLENDTVPMVVEATNDSICAGSTTTLNASANLGTINWYTTSTGGVSLYTGTSYSISSLLKDTTYYVDATYHGITSAIRNAVTVTVARPLVASAITGASPVCQGASDITYSIPADANVGYYNWILPEGVTNTTASTTNILKANFSSNAQSGNIIAKGHNACGNGPDNVLAIAVNTIPPTPVIVFNNIVLQSSATTGNQWYFNDAIVKDSINKTYTPTKNGSYYAIVTLNSCSSLASNTISMSNVGIADYFYNSNTIATPNPTKGLIEISIDGVMGNSYNIEVFNLLSTRFPANSIKRDERTIQTDLTGFPNGLYFIKLEANHKSYIIKVVKTN